MDTHGGQHALIVEDEIISGMGLRHLLEDLGFTSFAFASTSTQASECCRQRRPDLMTVDVQLLHGDGVGVVRQVREDFGAVPTVFVTGSPEAVNIRGAVVVEKPLSAAALARAVGLAKAMAEAA